MSKHALPRWEDNQLVKMSNAVAQVGPSVKFTVIKSSTKNCWVRSPQKITVVSGPKSSRKVTIVTGIVVFGTAVSSMMLTNPLTLKTVLPDRTVLWKVPPPHPSRQTRSTAKIRRGANSYEIKYYRIFYSTPVSRQHDILTSCLSVGAAARMWTGWKPLHHLC